MISNGLRDKKILKRIYELSSRALIKKYNAMNTLLAFSKGETDQGFENALPSIAIDEPPSVTRFIGRSKPVHVR